MPCQYFHVLFHSLSCLFLVYLTYSASTLVHVSSLPVVALMGSPVQIFREDPGSTCSPGTCFLPTTSSSRLLGWADYDNNASDAYEDLQQNHTNISPAIPIIITAVYSMVFVVGLVGNSLVMFVIIR